MSDFLSLAHFEQFAINVARAASILIATLLPIYYLEYRQRSDTSRYRRRHFAHDVAWALFYHSGAFEVIGASLIWGSVEDRLSFIKLGLLEGLPIVAQGLLYFVISD